MGQVQCQRCSAQVDVSDSVYSEQGDLLCSRCGAADDARTQAQRGYAARLEQAAGTLRPRGIVGAAMLAADVNLAGQHLHHDLQEIDAIAARKVEPVPVAAVVAPEPAVVRMVLCARCGASIDGNAALYSESGDLVCRMCNAKEVIAEGEGRAGASIFAASTAALVLGVVAIFYNPCLLLTFMGIASGITTWVQVYRYPEFVRRIGWKKNASLVFASVGILLCLFAPVLMIVLQLVLIR